MSFTFEKTRIGGALVIQPRVYEDSRGVFMETYKRSAFAAAGIHETFVQANYSCSTRGVLRGMHYQLPPHAQAKLISVIRGEIFDVIVDLRPEAPAPRPWVGMSLSAGNRWMLYVPPWCAHGFCVMSEEAEVVYLTSTEYAAEHETGIMWNDPALEIEWPVASPILSSRDSAWAPLAVATTTGEK